MSDDELFKAAIQRLADRFLNAGAERKKSIGLKYRGEEKTLTLHTAEQVAENTPVTAGRLLELAEAGLAPHLLIDGGVWFHLATVRAWVGANLVRDVEGAPMALTAVVQSAEPVDPVGLPSSLTTVAHLLRHAAPSSGVYFLLKGVEVVYVGQSVSVGARVATHWADPDKDFDRAVYMPVAPSDLLRVEASFIKALRPPLNRAGLPRLLAGVLP